MGRARPLGFLDLLLREEPVEGLLPVGTYRDVEVDPTHPLAAPLARWRDRPGVRRLGLDDLPEPDLEVMVAEMLHAEPVSAVTLASRGRPADRSPLTP